MLFSHSVVSNSLQPYGLQHARPPCPSPSPRLIWRCHTTISSSVIPFSCLQSLPASGAFLMNQLFPSGVQSIEVSASALVLLMNIQGWFPLGLTGFTSLLSKVLLSLLHSSKTSILWHSDFFIVQLFHPYKTTGKKTITLTTWTFVGKECACF